MAQQQYAGAALGEPIGFTGPAATVMETQANMKRFQLGVGKATWDVYGPIIAEISKMLGSEDPEHPSALQRTVAAGAVPAAALAMSAIAPGVAMRLGAPAWMSSALNVPGALIGKALTAPAGAMPFSQTAALAQGLAAGVGPGVSVTGTGLASTVTAPAGALYGLPLAAGAIGAEIAYPEAAKLVGQKPSERGAIREAGNAIWQIMNAPAMAWTALAQTLGLNEMSKIPSAFYRTVNPIINPEEQATPDQTYLNRFSRVGESMREFNKTMAPGVDKQTAGLYASVFGRSTEQMEKLIDSGDKRESQLMALLASTPEQMQKTAMTYSLQMGRASGLQYGDVGFDKYTQDFLRMQEASPARAMQAQERLERLSPYMQTMREAGLATDLAQPGMHGKDWEGEGPVPTVAEMLTPREVRERNQLAQGSPLAVSKRAMELGIPGMVSVDPRTGRGIGEQWGGGILAQQWGQESYIKPYMQEAGVQAQGANATFQAGGQTYDWSTQGISMAQMGAQRGQQDWEMQKNKEQMDLQYQRTTGGAGEFGRLGPYSAESPLTGIGEGFTLGGQVTIRIGGQTKIVTDTTTGEAISGRGEWQMADWQTNLSRMYQGQQLGYQGEQLEMGDRQFKENLEKQQGRSSWEYEFQAQGMAQNWQKMQTQYQWGKEDLAFRGQQASLQYGWGQEDTETALRYATGRERRQLLKKQERETISYSMGMGRLDTEGDRLDQRHKWDEEEFGRQQEYFKKKMQWTQEDFAMSLRQHNEQMDLSRRRLQTERDYFREGNRLADERTRLDRGYWNMTFTNQKVHLDQTALMQKTYRELESAQWALVNAQKAQGDQVKKQLEEIGPLWIAVLTGAQNKLIEMGNSLGVALGNYLSGQNTPDYWDPGE